MCNNTLSFMHDGETGAYLNVEMKPKSLDLYLENVFFSKFNNLLMFQSSLIQFNNITPNSTRLSCMLRSVFIRFSTTNESLGHSTSWRSYNFSALIPTTMGRHVTPCKGFFSERDFGYLFIKVTYKYKTSMSYEKQRMCIIPSKDWHFSRSNLTSGVEHLLFCSPSRFSFQACHFNKKSTFTSSEQ